jgi:hypothetical protein
MPRRQMLAKWLVNASYSGTVEDYYTLPEKYIYAKIAVASGATRSEYDYTSIPDRYTLSDIYKAVSGSSADTIDRGEKEALGWIAAAVRGDASDPVKVATYINWPWRYQVASIITALAVDSNAQSFITASGATDVRAVDQFVKGVKALGLYDSMVCWPLRSSQNAGTGTTAYSLGGLGAYNGTLVNGPTWGSNFLTLGSNRAVTAAAVNPLSFGSICDYTTPLTFAIGLETTRLNIGQGVTSKSISDTGVLTFVTSTSAATTAQFHLSASCNASTGSVTARMFFNGSFANSGTRNLTSTNTGQLTIGNFKGLSLPVNSCAFAWVSTSQLTDSIMGQFHALYKTTLGTGLGLP